MKGWRSAGNPRPVIPGMAFGEDLARLVRGPKRLKYARTTSRSTRPSTVH